MVRSWIGILALVLLALLLGCVVGLVFLWIRVLRNPGGSEPTCGKCGYAVQGLSALTCPECGSDFRAVGIDTPKQRGAVGPAVFVTLWTLLLPMPALVAIGIAVAMGPRQTVSQQNLTLTPIASSGYQDIDLYDAGFSGPWNTASSTTHLNVTLNPSGGAGTWAYMEVDLTAFTHEDFNAMTAPAPLDEQAVLRGWATPASAPRTLISRTRRRNCSGFSSAPRPRGCRAPRRHTSRSALRTGRTTSPCGGSSGSRLLCGC